MLRAQAISKKVEVPFQFVQDFWDYALITLMFHTAGFSLLSVWEPFELFFPLCSNSSCLRWSARQPSPKPSLSWKGRQLLLSEMRSVSWPSQPTTLRILKGDLERLSLGISRIPEVPKASAKRRTSRTHCSHVWSAKQECSWGPKELYHEADKWPLQEAGWWHLQSPYGQTWVQESLQSPPCRGSCGSPAAYDDACVKISRQRGPHGESDQERRTCQPHWPEHKRGVLAVPQAHWDQPKGQWGRWDSGRVQEAVPWGSPQHGRCHGKFEVEVRAQQGLDPNYTQETISSSVNFLSNKCGWERSLCKHKTIS